MKAMLVITMLTSSGEKTEFFSLNDHTTCGEQALGVHTILSAIPEMAGKYSLECRFEPPVKGKN